MRREGVAAADRELKRAIRARHRFLTSSDAEEIEDSYDAFLTHAGRVYEKLRAACHGHPLDWMWWKRKMDDRRDDPLLLYIHKARNTGTHRLEDVVKWASAKYYFRDFEAERKPIRGGLTRLMPLPVTDKEGRVYNPPTHHLGVDMRSMDVRMIIYLGLNYLQSLVGEAASRLR